MPRLPRVGTSFSEPTRTMTNDKWKMLLITLAEILNSQPDLLAQAPPVSPEQLRSHPVSMNEGIFRTDHSTVEWQPKRRLVLAPGKRGVSAVLVQPYRYSRIL